MWWLIGWTGNIVRALNSCGKTAGGEHHTKAPPQSDALWKRAGGRRQAAGAWPRGRGEGDPSRGGSVTGVNKAAAACSTDTVRATDATVSGNLFACDAAARTIPNQPG